MESLHAEDLHELERHIPHLRSSEPLMYLAERKLLPQQHDLESFENPSILTRLRRMTYGHTREEKQLMKRQQEAMVPFQQEQQIKAKLRAVQDFQMANAPTALQAHQQYGMPLEESQLMPAPVLDPRSGMAAKTHQYLMEEQQLQQLAAQPDADAGLIAQGREALGQRMPDRIFAPQALADPVQPMPQETRLKPYQLEQLEDVRGGRGQFENGQYVPMALAKPRPGLMNPDDIIEGAQLRETMGLAPAGTTEALRKAPPTRPLPATQVGQALDDVTKKFVEVAKEKTNKQEFKELEDPETGDKAVYLVDKVTGDIVRKVGKAPRSVNDLLGLDRTREVLVRMGHDPYETALRATRGDQAARSVVEEARQIAKQEEIEIKSAGERAQIEARPLDPVDRNAIVTVNEFKRNIANIEKIPQEKLKQYVGYFSLPSHQLIQIGRQDPQFAQFMTSIGFLQRDFFSDETAGSALTKSEIGILRLSIPTGNEWGGYTDFRAKLNDAKERADSVIDGRLKLSTETRGQSRDRLTGKQGSQDVDRKLDELLNELRKKR